MSKFKYLFTRSDNSLYDFRPPEGTGFTPDEVTEIRALVRRYGPPRKIAPSHPRVTALTVIGYGLFYSAVGAAVGALAGSAVGLIGVLTGLLSEERSPVEWLPFYVLVGVGIIGAVVFLAREERDVARVWRLARDSSRIARHIVTIDESHDILATAVTSWRRTSEMVARIKETTAWSSGLIDDHHIRVNLDETLTQIQDRVYALADLHTLRADGLPVEQRDNLDGIARQAVADTKTRVAALGRYAAEIDALSAECERLRELEEVETRLPSVLDALAASGVDLAEARYLDDRAAEIKARREAISDLVGLITATRAEIEAAA